MEERLGVFQPCSNREPTQEAPRQPEPLRQDHSGRWNEYRRFLEKHRTEKEAAQMEQRVAHRKAREAQLGSFRNERSELSGPTKWSGNVLNVARSLMASGHARRKAQLVEEHKRDRDLLRRQFGHRPTFEQFLIANDDRQLAQAWRYRQSPVVEAALFGEGEEQPLKRDIRDYTALVNDQNNTIDYSKRDSTEISFTDRGKRIDVWKTSDEAAVLAALQLGAQKWGALTITGPTEFKLLCAEVAEKHGIRINNPELQRVVAKPAHASQPTTAMHSERTSPDISYRSHKRDILNRVRVPNPSRLDWMIPVRMRVTGHDQLTIAAALRDNAKEGRAEESRNWSNYAERTAEAVFGPRGDRESATNLPRAYAWAQVEGRDLGREQSLHKISQLSINKRRERGGHGLGE
jgi:hypothetical protein